MDDSQLLRRRKIILWCGVVLSFFTSMSKILVPGPIVGDLKALGLNDVSLSYLAFGYYCAYAVSQLVLGMYSIRWGGVRLLLFGGSCFVAGSLLFPLSDSYWVMFAARVLTGLGAGTLFPGLAKLISDLYTKRFAVVFSVVMFLGYLGPICGRVPVLQLVKVLKWRWALETIALSSLAVFAVLVISSYGATKPVMGGNSLAALRKVFGSGRNLLIFMASSVVYGAYYVLPVVAGQECLIASGMSKYAAEYLLTALAVMIALGNLATILLLKLFCERRKLLLLFAGVCGLGGGILGAAAFQYGLPLYAVMAAFVLVAIPACFFSLQSMIVRELNPPTLAGPSISMLNFCAFVLIMTCQPAAGIILHRAGTALVAYRNMFIFFIALEAVGIACALFVPETRPKREAK